MSLDRLFLFLGAVSGLVAVLAGALAAHVLKVRLDAAMLVVFETAVRYQMYHALALGIVAWVIARFDGRVPIIAGALFIIGSLLFCGSLYAYALSGLRGFAMGAPFGGAALIGGWACLAWAALVGQRRSH